jgi:hypothetical protein
MAITLPATLAQLRLDQGRLGDARAAISQLPTARRGQRAIAAWLQARLRAADGDHSGAAALLERELGTLLTDGQPRLTLFALPLVTAGEWRLARGDPRGADSIAQLAQSAAAIDSAALGRSALAGRALLLHARALRMRGDLPNARHAATAAVLALGNGYGSANRWTAAARSLADSLAQ